MRQFDSKGLELAKEQGRLFAQSITSFNGSSSSFAKTFMNSYSCEIIDRNFIFNIDDILFELNNKKLVNIGKNKIHYDVMYWIGYIYRCWSYVYEETSRNIYKNINCEDLAKLYEPYHSIDPLNAIERIRDAKNIRSKLSQKDLYKKMFF